MKIYFILLLSFISCYAIDSEFSEIEKQLKSLETSQQISEQWVSRLQIIQSTLTTLSTANNFALKKYRFKQTNDPNEYLKITKNSQKIASLQENLSLLIFSRKTEISAYNKKAN